MTMYIMYNITLGTHYTIIVIVFIESHIESSCITTIIISYRMSQFSVIINYPYIIRANYSISELIMNGSS